MTRQAQDDFKHGEECSAEERASRSEEDVYPLTRGSTALTRINLLQYVWRETLGYLVHPKIAADSQVRKVADVATASGLWLCEVANSGFHGPELHGFDISPSQFISSRRLPSNVNLRVADVSKPPPAELQGKYDCVHVRLLQSMVNDNDPTWIIDHCRLLLRPGGYLQWEELDPLAMKIDATVGDYQSDYLGKLIEKLQTRVPGRWISELPKTLENCGFETLTVERHREPLWHRFTTTYLFCLVVEEFATASADKLGPTQAGTELKHLVRGAYGEAADGLCTSSLFQVVVGKKVA